MRIHENTGKYNAIQENTGEYSGIHENTLGNTGEGGFVFPPTNCFFFVKFTGTTLVTILQFEICYSLEYFSL